MAPTVVSAKYATKRKPRVLVVDDEPDMIQLVRDTLGKEVDCQILSACDLEEASRILAAQPVELLLADLNLPDGNGLSLVKQLREKLPTANTIVITGNPSVNAAVSAMRDGAVDFLPKPFSATCLIDRVNKALEKQHAAAKVEKRLDRLREAVRRLNNSRRTVTKKVDLLCNDLVSAYGELSRQFDDVRHQESFRKLLMQAGDLEQLLCHAMDWLLKKAGYSNVAIWLAADGEGFQLGAYMKYTIAGDNDLTNAMRDGLVPIVTREGFMHLSNQEVHSRCTPAELDFLADQTVLGVNCAYLGESLGAFVLFRDAKAPYTDEDAAMLKAISPIFAATLASIVKRAGNADDEDGGGALLDDDDAPRPNKADGDWWKRGEAPPF